MSNRNKNGTLLCYVSVDIRVYTRRLSARRNFGFWARRSHRSQYSSHDVDLMSMIKIISFDPPSRLRRHIFMASHMFACRYNIIIITQAQSGSTCRSYAVGAPGGGVR